jgi:hypothetical protein
MFRRLLILVLPLLLLACGGPELLTAQPSTKCPLPGTGVSLAQMMGQLKQSEPIGPVGGAQSTASRMLLAANSIELGTP